MNFLQTTRPLLICGIDPGANTGIVILQKVGKYFLLKFNRTVKSSPKKPLVDRLGTLFRAISTITDVYRPETILVEGMRHFPVARGSVKSTVIQAQFHGAVLAALGNLRYEAKVVVVPPPRVQWAGRGRIRTAGQPTKKLARILCRQYLGKQAEELTEHEADAAALCLWLCLNANKKGEMK